MAQKNGQDALNGLDELIAAARARLATNPDYIALRAMEKARAEIVGIKPSQTRTIAGFDELLQNLGTGARADSGKRVSQLDAAAMALESMGHPMPVELLMEKAVEHGAVVGGAKPAISFGSSLSKSERFKSVRWRGKYAWWFSDRAMPSPIKRIRAREIEAAEQEAAE
jgi:hypothetical protein